MAAAPLSMVYRSEKQIPRLNQALQEFYQREEFCDVTLVAGSKRIKAHKVILASSSPYFYHCLNQKGPYNTELSCHQFDEQGLKSLIDFCYMGVITVDSVSAERMLSVATTLQIKEVEKLCLTFLRAHQSFVCEISSESRNTNSLPTRGSNSDETFYVESSGKFSPSASPNVSTSGRPSSEAGSADNADVESVTVKQEHLESSSRSESERMFVKQQSDENSPLSPFRKLPVVTSQGVNIIDMSQISPPFLNSPFPRASMFIRPPPPQLQIFPPRSFEPVRRSSESSSNESVEQKNAASGDYVLAQQQSSASPDIVTQSMQAANLPSPEIVQQQASSIHMCPLCQQQFNSSQSLKLHMMLHEQQISFPQFSQKRNRKSSSPQKNEAASDDLKQVEPGQIFTCSTCGKSFKDGVSLKFHKYNHILRHPCNICGKRFSRSWNLQRHKKSHFKVESWPQGRFYSSQSELQSSRSGELGDSHILEMRDSSHPASLDLPSSESVNLPDDGCSGNEVVNENDEGDRGNNSSISHVMSDEES